MNALREIEQAVLAEGREWTRRRLEERLQQAGNALETACPVTGRPLQETRGRDLQLHTVSGVIHLRVRHGYSAARGEWICPARDALGLAAYQRVSPELEARVCYTATAVGSYEGAAAMAQRWGSPVSDDLIHHHVQHRGAATLDLTLPSPAVPRPSAAAQSNRSAPNSSAASAAAASSGCDPAFLISSHSPSSSKTRTILTSGTENHRQPGDAPHNDHATRSESFRFDPGRCAATPRCIARAGGYP
jgi:hypothetical protein